MGNVLHHAHQVNDGRICDETTARLAKLVKIADDEEASTARTFWSTHKTTISAKACCANVQKRAHDECVNESNEAYVRLTKAKAVVDALTLLFSSHALEE